jgi:D-alanine-D-alanine ligase
MKRVAVLRGGPSEEYAVSMQTGAGVLQSLQRSDYATKDIVITKKGEWLDSGFVRQPEAALEAIDIVFIALHGTYGEDGQVQKILERKCLPFTGSRSLPSAIAFNKDLTKQTVSPHGIAMPRHRRVSQQELPNLARITQEIGSEIGHEYIVKPVANGSSLGTRYAPHREALERELVELLSLYDQVMVEEYIRGREATVGVLGDFRNESLYVLPVVEIVPPGGNPLFSHEDKYSGKTEEIVPGAFLVS